MSEPKKVIIIGASGHAKVIADIVIASGDTLVGFLDREVDNENILGYPVLGNDSEYKKYLDCYFIIGIGDNKIRERLSKKFNGVKWYTAIHPSAIISALNVTIGEGTVIMANAVINPSVNIGKHCIINSSSVVEHDDNIGDYCHISVGAKLAGSVSVTDGSFIGIGVVVKDGIKINEVSIIGAGAVVVKNIDTPGVYVGVPTKLV